MGDGCDGPLSSRLTAQRQRHRISALIAPLGGKDDFMGLYNIVQVAVGFHVVSQTLDEMIDLALEGVV